MLNEIPAHVHVNAIATVIHDQRAAHPDIEQRDLIYNLYRAGFSARELSAHFDAALAVANGEDHRAEKTQLHRL